MDLGNFSVSLSVKDLAASRDFYEKLGFETYMDFATEGWVIVRNATATVGLFQGMFEGNLLTFNPGWDRDANELLSFMDAHKILVILRAKGLVIENEAEETAEGPASFMITDPDGNRILVDQHV